VGGGCNLLLNYFGGNFIIALKGEREDWFNYQDGWGGVYMILLSHN